MRVLAFLLALLIFLVIGFWMKATVDFRYRRIDEKDHINIQLHAFHGLWNALIEVPTIQLEWEKGPQLEVEQVSITKGGVRKAKAKARIRYVRRGWLYRIWLSIPRLLRFLKRIQRQFYQGIHCNRLNWRIEIGYKDPAQTAIVAGAFWTMIGFALSRLYKQVTVEDKSPSLMVVPQFKKEGFLCDIQCIFNLRIGHIILVGINLLLAFKRGIRG